MIKEIQNMIMAIRDWANGKFQKKGNYVLAENAGYSLGLNIDSDYIMTIELKNADGNVISEKSVDFPIESMVVGASYAGGVVTLSLQNGQTIDVDVSDLVRGLVSDNFTIAGIDMKDDITKEELVTALGIDEKVDKVGGKGLSTNDYTTEEKNKLSGIASGAEVNVQSDWNVTDAGSDAYIKNKPAIPSVGNGTVTIRQSGTQKGTFTMNQSGNTTIELTDNNTTYSAGPQLDLSGTGFKLKDFCTTITDWDAATTNGWYMAHNAAHSPADGWMYGIVIAHNAGYVRQIVYHFATGANVSGANCDRYERVKDDGIWGAWVNTSVKKEIPGNAQIIRAYTSNSTVADKAGCWYKIATVSLAYIYNDATMHSFIHTHANGIQEVYYMEYVARIKQQTEMGSAPLLDVSVCYRKGIAAEDLKFVVVENSGTVTRAELWCRIRGTHTMHTNSIYSTDGNIIINGDMTLQQNPPEGTGQFVYGTDKAYIHEADLLDGKHFSDIKTMIDSKQNIRNGVISGNADWNTFTTPGAYKVQSAAMTDAMHAPNGERQYGVLYVIESESGGENRIMQLYFPHTSIYHDMWRRMRNGGTWTPWVGMYSTEHPSPDAKVEQNNTADNKRLRLLLSHGANNTDETDGAYKNANLTFNPATGDLFALGWDRVDITGKTVDADTINLSSGTPHIMRYICKSSAGAANITHIPVAGNPFILDVFLVRWGSAADYITRQDFYSVANNIEYTRYCVNGTWSDWKHKDTTYTGGNQISISSNNVINLQKNGEYITDWNAAIYNGFYQSLNDGNSTTLHAPGNGVAHCGMVIATATTRYRILQYVWSLSSSGVINTYQRTCTDPTGSSSWTAWERVIPDGGGAGKYIQSIKEVNGKMLITEANMPTIPDISGKVNKSGDRMTGDLTVKTMKISSVPTGTGMQMSLTNVASEGVILYDNSFVPLTDNYTLLGGTGHRWKQLVSVTSTISTSDRNLKKNISDLSADDRYMKFFMLLQPKSYLFKDGESGRSHVGFISQDVEDAMTECGLSSLEFAGFCKDRKTEGGEPVFDEAGNPVYEYSLRYEEFIALNTMMIQKQQMKIDKLEERIDKIESMIEGKTQNPTI